MALPQLVAAPARLERMLASAVAREERFIPRSTAANKSDVAVTNYGRKVQRKTSSTVRTDALEWLRRVNYTVFRLCPNNFALAVNVFDRFHALVKVQPKHVPCIAAASFLIAAKITQEPESEPSAAEVVDLGDCKFTPCDVTRMERIILGKLGWDVDATTPLSVLQLMHALLCSWGVFAESGVSAVLHLHTSIQHLESCLMDETFAFLRPSSLALAVLAVELRQVAADWLDITIDLQTISKVTGQQLSVGYEALQTRMFHLRRQSPQLSVTISKKDNTPIMNQPAEEFLQKPCTAVRCLFPSSPNASDSSKNNEKNSFNSFTSQDIAPVSVPPQQLNALNPSAKPFVLLSSSNTTPSKLDLASRPQVIILPQTPIPNSLSKHQSPASAVIDRLVQIKLSPSRCGNVLIASPGLVMSSVKVV